ncbi:hypothetical protein LJR219_002681 [Phenylobacterium sp. LjRoot219]|uniref:CpsD/CapB family tyrosine-protein kinase n=1 Tax=Phenylobacterium sp. LjRoot219 TaxID=3342283 RepID=UPI003ED0CB40
MRLQGSTARTTRSDAARGRNAEARRRIGEILLAMGAITREQFTRIMAEQERTGELFGEAAQRLGLVTTSTLARAVENQQDFTVLRRGDPGVDPLVVAAYAPQDPLAERVRELRGVLTASITGPAEVRSIGVLGLDAEVATAVLCANLGVAFAQAGYRTLLIDSNLDAPVQNGLFRLHNRFGLTTLLSSGGAHQDVVQASAIRNLWLQTTGPAVPNGSELLDGGRLAARLQALFDLFDVVLVDASAGDAKAFAACDGLDGGLVVTRKDVTRLAEVRAACAWLGSRGASLLGTVVTS